MSELERALWASAVLLAYGVFCVWTAFRNRRANTSINTTTPSYSEDKNTEVNGQTLVAYASQTGGAKILAKAAAALLRGNVTLVPLNQVDASVLASARRAVVIASTYGKGEPPENGLRFAKRFFDSTGPNLRHLEYAVLALGDSQYSEFCHFGRNIYDKLAAFGARPVGKLVELDAQHTSAFDAVMVSWRKQLKNFGIDETKLEPSHTENLSLKLHRRRCLNPGSPGQPLFHLSFVANEDQKCTWSAGDLISVLPSEWRQTGLPVIARKYSIASTPSDGCLDLVVRQHCDEHGALGLASGWLTEYVRLGDTVSFTVCENESFRSPEINIPLIMIGNGSGFAGLRAHIRQRVQWGGGRNWLIFGERHPVADRIFSEEIDEWYQQGYLERRDLTFSRCEEQAMYVQDCLYTHSAKLREWIEMGAVFMVCGSREGMALGVKQALIDILGEAELANLMSTERYRLDVY